MIKLIVKLCFICSFIFVSSFVQAGIIPADITTITADIAPNNTGEVSQDNYITHYNENSGKNWDIAWASDVNSELWFEGDIYNTLFSADTHVGWTTMGIDVSSGRLELFSNMSDSEVWDLFRVGSTTTFIHAFEYWNSEFLFPLSGDPSSTGLDLRSEMTLTLNDFKNIDTINYDRTANNHFPGAISNTFYFRESAVQPENSKPVPEPSTLMIFSLGLIALASRKKLIS